MMEYSYCRLTEGIDAGAKTYTLTMHLDEVDLLKMPEEDRKNVLNTMRTLVDCFPDIPKEFR